MKSTGRRYLTGLISCFFCSLSFGQSVGTCDVPLGEAYLDVGNVRARIVNTGGLFYRGEPHVYNVPKNSATHPIFVAMFWIGGWVDGQLRTAASRYYNTEFWAGPIDDNSSPPIDCSTYDRIYSVYRTDLENYLIGDQPAVDLADWPTGLGAPTIDSNGDPVELNHLPLAERQNRRIDLEAGEQPALLGDQTIWWVMNDRGNEHRSTKSAPLGIEVHVTAFAVGGQTNPVTNSTFYKYRVINRNTSSIDSIYIGLNMDPDLGYFADDYVGSDSVLGLGFVYNADNFDEGSLGYGSPPPALGMHMPLGPLVDVDGVDNDGDGEIDEKGERLSLKYFVKFGDGGGVTETPIIASDYYGYMQARWKNGQRITEGGYGYRFSEIPVNFMYAGDPITGAFWSEFNIDGLGTPHDKGDRLGPLISTGPFDLAPGQETDFVYSIVFAQGSSNLDSITRLKEAVVRINSIFDDGYTAFQRIVTEPVPETLPTYDAGIGHNYPDPFTDITSIAYLVPSSSHVRLIVFNALGRQILTLVNELREAGEYSVTFDGSHLPSGVYYYRLEIGHASATSTMVLVK